MNLPNLEAIINRSEVKPMKNNYNFLLKADKGLKMGLGKTREANNVMGLASPANDKQYNSTHILPQTNRTLENSIHDSTDPFHNLNVIMNKVDPYSNVNDKNSLVKQFINT